MSNFCLKLPTPFCCPVRIRAPCVSVLSTACAVTSPVCFRVQVFCFSLSLQGAPACISEAAALPPCVSGFYTHHALTHTNFHIRAHREIDVSAKPAVCTTVLTQNQRPISAPALGKPHPAILCHGNPTSEAALRLPLTL